uniref:3-keto-alpha-glucoside-1,2-lyase/3-keto-2-hydroxy-glucal hydratase domain-containing protein n=1 Tax=Solibacter usitatus (strain Ellin6076) TaxID=234267 RepID=Q026J8_SOLUE
MHTRRKFGSKVLAAGMAAIPAIAQKSAAPPGQKAGGRSFETPEEYEKHPEGSPIPGQKWKVHDLQRPLPPKVTPALPISSPAPPADAIVLFNGKDLSQWVSRQRGGAQTEANWKVENGYVEMVPQSGSIATREKFGDCQLHVEWTTLPPSDPSRHGQGRGNGGVVLMERYEIQVLSGYDNPTYSDGTAGALYGLYPPMVNPTRPEGEWNSFDVFFESPRFQGSTVVKPAYVTLIFNGLLAHHRVELLGSTSTLPLAKYQPHAAEESLVLQGHTGPTRYRNIWIRRLKGYDTGTEYFKP